MQLSLVSHILETKSFKNSFFFLQFIINQPNIRVRDSLIWYPYVLMCRGRYMSCRLCWSRRSFFPRNHFRLWLRFWIILVWPRTPICASKLDHSNSKQKHTHTQSSKVQLGIWFYYSLCGFGEYAKSGTYKRTEC